MSGTILYLAIVAIWAGVLVPRWLRREHHRGGGVRSRSRRAGVSDSLTSSVALVAGGAEAQVLDPGGPSVTSGAEALPQQSSDADGRVHDTADPRRHESSHVLAGERAGVMASRNPRGGHSDAALRRARVINARRRLLSILTVLAVAAAAVAADGLAAWWVVAPPAGMLACYLTLLREAARADAELQQARDAASHRRAAAPEQRSSSREATREAMLAKDLAGSARGPIVSAGTSADTAVTGQVLDITERVNDEIYDQHADAKLRAVGD